MTEKDISYTICVGHSHVIEVRIKMSKVGFS